MVDALVNLDDDGKVIDIDPDAKPDGDDIDKGDPTPGEPSAGGDDGDKGLDGDKDKGGDPSLEDLLEAKDAEIRELRQMSRDNKRKTDTLEVSLEEQGKALRDAKIIEEDPEEVEKANAARDSRNEYLDNVLELMRVNSNYADVDDVVSQDNVDDMVQAWALAYQEDNGGKLSVITRNIEAEIWGHKNPYRYLYDLIKKTHPTYNKEKGRKVDIAKDKDKDQPSIEDIPGGGGSDNVGWTAARIDGLDEEELNTVPADVYSRYLRNQLK